MAIITRSQLCEEMEKNRHLAIVEVLGPDSYEACHLPRARNVPLGDGFEAAILHLLPDKSQTVVVYCRSRSCLSCPIAARKLESLGYQNVLQYADGKRDWEAAGLPLESLAG